MAFSSYPIRIFYHLKEGNHLEYQCFQNKNMEDSGKTARLMAVAIKTEWRKSTTQMPGLFNGGKNTLAFANPSFQVPL